MSKRIIAIFCVVLGLSGCEEDAQKTILPAVVVDDKVRALPIEPEKPEPIVVEPDPEPELDIEVPDIREGINELEAIRLRGDREALFKKINKRINRSPVKRFDFEDKDYKRWDEGFPEDKSTYPVDRSRMLTEEMMFSGVLERDINSQIPGKIVAIIDRDVLSVNGKYILLPAYTKIVCDYEGLSQTGDTRLSVTCRRIIRPDGVSIALNNAIAADQMGRVGLIGNVDNRTFERYGGAFIMSGISALAQSGVNTERQSWARNSSNILSNNLGQVTSEVIKRNIDLRPIISIKAGSKIQIIPQSDIVLRSPMEEVSK